MARIPDTEIDQIKSGICLQRWVEASGVALNRHGADWVGRCPFHDDRTPSLVITPAKNLWHCLGACQQGGTVVDWVMKEKNISFRHAVELLRQELSPLAADQPPVETATGLPPLFAREGDHQATLKRVVTFYHETLKASPDALDYLRRRGIDHSEVVEHFRLGHANRTLAYRLPPSGNKTGAELRSQLQQVGILRASGHEHFSGSLVIPVLDEAGNVQELYGRKILGNRLRKGTPLHTYLPGPHRGVFNIAAFRVSEAIILCESLLDALTFWCAGFRNVTASYGVNGFTEEHLTAFKTHAIKKVYIAYDRDEAGDVAAEKLAEQLMAEGMDCFRVLFPKGTDANEYACQVKPAEKSLGVVLRKAEWMGNGQQKAAKESTPVPSIDVPVSEPSRPMANEAAAAISEQQVVMTLDGRRYRVRGLQKNTSPEQLRINLLIQQREQFYVDTLDLYSARHRAGYVKQASLEVGLSEETLKQDLGKVLLKLEELQDQQIKGVLTRQSNQPKMNDAELKAALAFLKSPDLMDRVLRDFESLGVVGETTNKLVGYLAAVSRKLDKPLAVMVQSSSAAGKSSLMEAVLQLMPPEERVQYSAMTGQSLFYMGEQDLKHKILAIAEEAGAMQTAYALKLLQSEGEVSIASTGKNTTTGNLETQVYRVEGPVMLFSTTTAIDIDEELMNRCLVLSVDETRAQTRAIHAAQRQKRTLAGLRARQQKQALIALHQNAQRLLRPLAVLNPYADRLTFLDAKTRTRRDHEKYLTLIDAIALLHQYQRPVYKDKHQNRVTEYIEVTQEDIALANQIAHDVLGKSLDELPPQTRRLLQLLTQMVQAACKRYGTRQPDYRFSRKMARDYCGWSDAQIKKHLKRLEDLEYVLIHKGKRGQSYEYELLYQGEGETHGHFVLGLIDPDTLVCDAKKERANDNKGPLNSPRIAVKSPPGHTGEIDKSTGEIPARPALLPLPPQKGHLANGLASHHTEA